MFDTINKSEKKTLTYDLNKLPYNSLFNRYFVRYYYNGNVTLIK